MESGPPETAQSTEVADASKVHLANNWATSGCDRKLDRGEGISPAQLLLCVALATVWVLHCRNFGNIANNQLHNGKAANNEKNQTQPKVPYDCDHGFNYIVVWLMGRKVRP